MARTADKSPIHGELALDITRITRTHHINVKCELRNGTRKLRVNEEVPLAKILRSAIQSYAGLSKRVTNEHTIGGESKMQAELVGVAVLTSKRLKKGSESLWAVDLELAKIDLVIVQGVRSKIEKQFWLTTLEGWRAEHECPAGGVRRS